MATAGEGGVKIGHDFLMSVIQLLENPSQISIQSHTGQPMVTISGTQPVSMTTKAEKPKKQNLLIFTQNKSPVKKQNPIDKKPVIQKKPSSLIPHNRVRMIMKTAPNTTLLSQETIALASKAAELFIRKLSQVSFTEAQKCSSLSNVKYNHLVDATRQYPNQMQFLNPFLPHKIKVRDYMLMNRTHEDNDNKT